VKAYTNWSACLHGIGAENVRLRRDERHNALYLELDEGVSIRIDLNRADVTGGDCTDELERDRSGLLRLAEVAAQAAQEIEQLQQEADR
jgi:hypothetical protein